MDALIITAISVGVFSGIWAYLSSVLGLITWAGFLGCTAYFAAGGKREGFRKAVMTNLTGVIWAVIAIKVSGISSFDGTAALMTGIISFIMCAQAKFKLFDFIPGAFIGSCATFAAQGNWAQVIPALLCGTVLGYTSESLGIWIYEMLSRKRAENLD